MSQLACQGSFGWRILLTRQPDPPLPFPSPPPKTQKKKPAGLAWAGLDEASDTVPEHIPVK